MKKLPAAITISGLFLILFAIFINAHPTQSVSAGAPEPPEPTSEPTPWYPSPRLKKPELPDNPTLADQGAIPYWSICLSCHGDKGQGLTDEWREAGFGEDMNCWKSKCHALNHPTPGFNFPRQVPPVVGANTLQRFTTAQELKDYIKSTMPWWDPGSLSEQDSWNLTAYLLRENKVLPAHSELHPEDAAITPVHQLIRPRKGEFTWQYAISLILGLAVVLLVGSRMMERNSTIIPAAGKRRPRPNFFYHLHPPTIPVPQARWRYTLGAGGLAVFLALITGFTGILEMFFYIPTPEQAGHSIQVITFLVPFGGLVRGLHFWAAQALVVVTAIHLLRVIFTAAYIPPRRFNFLLGMGLFVVVIFLNFTGYILRWDNGIHWALVVGTNLLKTIPLVGAQIYGFIVGGETPGFATLTRFYAWHIFGLALVAAVLIVWHIFRVRRDGGISAQVVANEQSDPGRITRSELVRREVLAMIIAVDILILVSTLFPPPLAAPISDANMPLSAEVLAPWFFLWVQQLLRYGSAFLMGIGIPLGLLAILVSLPYIFPQIPQEQKGSWFPVSARVAQIVTVVITLGWLILTFMEVNR